MVDLAFYLFTVRIMNFPLLILSLVYIFRFPKTYFSKKTGTYLFLRRIHHYSRF